MLKLSKPGSFPVLSNLASETFDEETKAFPSFFPRTEGEIDKQKFSGRDSEGGLRINLGFEPTLSVLCPTRSGENNRSLFMLCFTSNLEGCCRK